jgi:hypothetical protein
VEKVGELHWVFDEKDWCVVADHIVVTLFGVMFESPSSGVAVAIVHRLQLRSEGKLEFFCQLNSWIWLYIN